MKCIPLGLYLLAGVFDALFSKVIVNELIVIFVVVDFWFTKNITGRKLLGIRWSFDDD